MKRYFAAKVEDVKANGRAIVVVKGMEVGIFHVGGQFYAWRNVCPHAAAPVCEGPVCGTRLPSRVYEYEYGKDREIVRCPWHGWEFDLRDGRHLADSGAKLRGFPVEVDGSDLFLLLQ
ncbi:Rieske (2Fe-2S) protein [Paenibacillus sp. GYB003]|uniref:Rieske (2Fe-2S) protein n=1 Tax=Paenibacillus sp. GYB003 TaxID=2994392 RepID=UPI002F96A6A6